MALNAEFHGILSADATLAAALASYASVPAVFTQTPVPEDASRPYIVTEGETVTPMDTKNTQGREVVRDIAVYVDKDDAVNDVDVLAERIRTIFHNVRHAYAGFCTLSSEVNGVSVAPTGDTVTGRIVTVTLRLAVI